MMAWKTAVLLSAIVAVSCGAEDLTFPPGFIFGAATAAYQVEGGWNASDKGESIWDRFTHEHPEYISDLSTGDVACDSYHLWERDIEMAGELGLQFYRFSISWPRLLPLGFINVISEDGKNYYNKLIDGLLAKGIEPFVTLYHWDLPLNLQDLGGWANPLIEHWFADYAMIAFKLFGNRVKWWITINEPINICDLAYSSGTLAPQIMSPEIGTYNCNKNVMMAHARAWRLYHKDFKQKYHGKVSIANHHIWFDPATKADKKLAELVRNNFVGRYSHPIYSKTGGWPRALEKVLEKVSLQKGYRKSVFPAFTREEIEFVKGTYDFYAMNHYTSRVIRSAKDGEIFRPWPLGDCEDLNAITENNNDWPMSESFWFSVDPEGIRRQLLWLRRQYGDLEFIITENGLSTLPGLEDQTRIDYYRGYLRQILLAIKEDGVKVTGYTAWSLMDNFEWTDGYKPKFGLYEVNFTDPRRMRTLRKSGKFYTELIKTHSLNFNDTFTS